MIVMKFGGTSVGTPQRIKTVGDLVISHLDRKPLVVLSAFSGVTNALLKCARDAYEGAVEVLPLIRRHREACEDLGVDKDLVTPLLLELKDLLKGISLVRELTPRSLDFAASFGERCSTRIVAEYLRKQRDVKAHAYDAWDLGLVTDDNFRGQDDLGRDHDGRPQRLGLLGQHLRRRLPGRGSADLDRRGRRADGRPEHCAGRATD